MYLQHLSTYLLLALILLLGAFLRFTDFWGEPATEGEIRTVELSEHNRLSEVFQEIREERISAPGYYLAVYSYAQTIGTRVETLRMPSALAGIAAIWLMFLFTSQLYDRRTALLSAGFLAFTYIPVQASRLAEPYSWMILLTILLALLTYKVLHQVTERTGPEPKSWFEYAFVLVFTASVHYSGLFISLLSLSIVTGYTLGYRRNRLALTVTGLLLVCSYIPWWDTLAGDLRELSQQDGASVQAVVQQYLLAAANHSWLLLGVLAAVLLWHVSRILRSLAREKAGMMIRLPEHKVYDLILLVWLMITGGGLLLATASAGMPDPLALSISYIPFLILVSRAVHMATANRKVNMVLIAALTAGLVITLWLG